MAAQEIKRDDETHFCVFAIESEKDLELLPTTKESGKSNLETSSPCAMGSVARTIDEKRYILKSDDKWIYANSSSGGGEYEDVEPIDTSTIYSLFG